MILSNVSQLVTIKNVISPKSSATTTASVPGWETFSKDTEILSVSVREVISKKEKTLNQVFNILEGSSPVGKITLSVEEAAMVLEGIKTFKVGYKMSTSQDSTGANYLNLVVLESIAPQPPQPQQEPPVTNEGKGGK
jgi:hypothetical protein